MIRALMALVFFAVAVRLVAMTALHPLNWDEIEFFRATDWVRQGLVPYRDFWEHHTPLQWFVFAPFTALTKSAGASSIIVMRWAQALLWVATFWIANRWMTAAGLTRFARWAAMVLAVCSSFLMLPAMEYRVDVLASALYLAGLLLLQRDRPFAAGVALCLAGFANLRLGPLLAVTAILALFVDTRERKWRFTRGAFPLYAGVLATLAVAFFYFGLTRSLPHVYRYVWVENYLGDRYATPVPWAFIHRILVPFGIRIYGGGEDRFLISGVDLAGSAILIVGFIGIIRALRRWRTPDLMVFLAVLQIVNVLFIAKMVFVYHYHFEIVVLLMLPFVAGELDRVLLPAARGEGARRADEGSSATPLTRPSATLSPRCGQRGLVLAFLIVCSILNAGFALLRGKEDDLAYQDLIMREVHARTAAPEKVFDGVGWALRRDPAYERWFLPELVRELVRHGHITPYRLSDWLRDPPAAVITDRNAAVWLARNPELGVHAVRHYLPLWRNLWLPGMSSRISSGAATGWMVPADGVYRVFASPRIASDPWFTQPLAYGVARPAIRFEGVVADPPVEFWRNGVPVGKQGALTLKRGDHLRAMSHSGSELGIFLVRGDDTIWFRQPPRGVTLDSEAPRVTHLPRPYNVFSERTPTWSAQP